MQLATVMRMLQQRIIAVCVSFMYMHFSAAAELFIYKSAHFSFSAMQLWRILTFASSTSYRFCCTIPYSGHSLLLQI